MAKKTASRKTQPASRKKQPAARSKQAAARKKPGTSRKKQTATTKKQALVVTCSGNRPIHEVAKDLKAAGFEVGQILASIGSVTGFAHAKVTKQLKTIRGVADVSKDHQVDIGPPGAPVS